MDEIFKALADRNRRIILTLLKNQGKMTVSELLKEIKSISQPTLSSHLAVLKKARLVDSQVAGKWRRYYLKEETLNNVISELSKFIGNGNLAEIKARRS
ncbi:metalloregulator ArsR/SmtB family transcription factor [Patescibacteria group bacterium]|nr:metalloregulator ArsR/SmtB family transcription factor [Patescibacteria group bacterium]